MITNEKLEIFKKVLCEDCIDRPMDICIYNCVKKEIYTNLEENVASDELTDAGRSSRKY